MNVAVVNNNLRFSLYAYYPRAGRRQPSYAPFSNSFTSSPRTLKSDLSHWQPFIGNDQMVSPGRISADPNSEATDRYPPIPADEASGCFVRFREVDCGTPVTDRGAELSFIVP